ncbi:HAD-IA family hydrolase [Pontiella sulfatireligans]|uniref:Alpha-D-glucose 1-phosphate phosphatase YihX n=1 Tax=Pontiella sulfatireligans TaxID=2750658 RepID=A0A6C2UTQ1_9BACT|nr:HAD-IA family hydrolase [Pontiella sulfatireligans]VGO23343.1 Alpha-D-glucose 1-phosphate phosphatase YihX [Pontiella sulfatireligans]
MKYFLFDIGNVLVDFNAQDFLDAIAAEAGREVEPLTARDLERIDAVETGRLSDAGFVDYLNEAKGLSWTVDDLVAMWSKMFSLHETGQGLFLDALKADVQIYTLSNIAQHHVDAIENNWSGFFDKMTGLFMSYKMGVRKPDMAIYTKVLDHLGALGEECFFLDDKPENVEVAREAGIEAYQFVPENHEAIRNAANEFFGL